MDKEQIETMIEDLENLELNNTWQISRAINQACKIFRKLNEQLGGTEND